MQTRDIAAHCYRCYPIPSWEACRLLGSIYASSLPLLLLAGCKFRDSQLFPSVLGVRRA